jgi:hypothetical protein
MVLVFIIAGALFVIFAISGLMYFYLTNPLTKILWHRRGSNLLSKIENRQKLRQVKKQYKALKIKEEIREKSEAIKRKLDEQKGLSERDIQKIQKQGLRYIEEEKR